MNWRVAESLDKNGLLGEINLLAPSRSRAADGGIGDAAHATRNSDHNPYIKDKNNVGVVRARDFTHDPKNGFDSYLFADSLRKNKDRRVRYVISNAKIWTPTVSQEWRKYSGSNPHDHHCHVSVVEGPQSLYDDTSDWVFEKDMLGKPILVIPGDRPVQTVKERPVLRQGMGTVKNPNEDVAKVQQMLDIKPDGAFGPTTKKAVAAFQKQRGLDDDGVVGFYTWQALDSATKVKTAAKAPASNFDRVMEFVFDDEGGLNIHPDEPDGASNMGISLQTLRRAKGSGATLEHLKMLTPSDAKQIYRQLYWDAIKADELPSGLSYAAFDFAVNSGTSVVDQIGLDDFLTKALKEPSVPEQIDKLSELRIQYMKRNPEKWERYHRGWTNRVDRVENRALTLAA